MANDPGDSNFGGRISVTAGTDRFPPSDADISIEPTNIKVEAKANGDGSPCFTASPKLFGAKIKFRDRSGIVWNDVIRKTLDVTIVEEDNSRTHIFTSARIVGEPDVNLSTGEVEGCEIRGPQYQKLNS
ncbi:MULTISPECIES: hypothetical protein [unclassified Bradyrhizobium]|uniref:hypothetical protein n=1 Tax=unclassified Bradyrhizobium TaxID=2631580 RepID=UPI0028E4989E|nr:MULTISPECIES: hypothetical protein [unclassified Bradyrhizobium]